MRTLSYLAFRAIVLKFSLIPFGLLYFISDIFAFFLFKVIRYRRKVIRENLSYCFPSKSISEIAEIENSFFKNFSDILLESIKAFSSNPQAISDRYKLINPEVLEHSFNNKENVILLTQHYGNWEWGGYCLGNILKHDIVVMYKNLSHPLINRYIKRKRKGKNICLVDDSRQLYNSIGSNTSSPKAIFFVIDQYPANIKKTIKVNFFNQKISFNSSAFVFANHIYAPCYFIDAKRIKRGHYELEIKPLPSISESKSTHEILQSYVKHLESIIRKDPTQWMWTHKRFKDEIDY